MDWHAGQRATLVEKNSRGRVLHRPLFL